MGNIKENKMIKECLKFAIIAGVLVLLTSCGDNVYHNTYEEIRDEYEAPRHQLEGYFYFDKGGEVEVLKDSFGRYTVTTHDYPTSINPENDTFGVHPRINIRDKFLTESGQIKVSLDVNYSNDFDLEEDVSGDNITGKKRTDFIISIKDDKLEIHIKIFSDEKRDNPNFIIAERLLKGSK